MENLNEGNNKGTIEYTRDGNDYVMTYQNLPEQSLVLVMQDEGTEVFAQSNAIGRKLLLYCVITCIIIVLVVYLLSLFITKPLKVVEQAVGKLGALSLKPNNDIQPYVESRSEIGRIATAVDRLTKTWSEIINTMEGCATSLGSGALTMRDTAVSLVDCATDNMATTQQLSASITNVNVAIQKMNGEIQNITELVNIVNEMVKNSGKKVRI